MNAATILVQLLARQAHRSPPPLLSLPPPVRLSEILRVSLPTVLLATPWGLPEPLEKQEDEVMLLVHLG